MDRHLYELSKEEMQEKIKILIGNLSIRNQLKVITENIFEKKNTQEIMEFLDINGNILLYGKPGTGKTSMCYECMLNYESASCCHLNISTLISEKMGKTAKLVGNFFEDIIKKAKKYRVFLLVEEIEAFLPDRSSSKELEDMKRALTVFMHYLDKKIPNLVVLCTTNHKSNLDDAITRRFAFQYEITNNEKESFIQFLIFEANPFKDDFIDSSINNEIAEILVDNECTFSDLKHFMRELFISGNKVTSKNLLQQIKEATMSNNIILTRYTEAENGKFSENESKNIDSTVLPETIFEGIDESYFKLVEIQEEDSEKIYEQKIINESKINELLDYLKIIIKKEINKTLDDKLTIEAEDVILNNLRLLLNVRNIVLVKVEKFNDDKNLMLVVG